MHTLLDKKQTSDEFNVKNIFESFSSSSKLISEKTHINTEMLLLEQMARAFKKLDTLNANRVN